MNERTKNAILAAVFVLGLAGLFFCDLPLPSPPGARRRKVPVPRAPLGTQLTATRVVGRVHGAKEWEFSAGRIVRSLDGLVITAYGVGEGRVYHEGKLAWIFEAGYLRYHMLTRRLEAREGVVGRSAEGDLVFRAPAVIGDLGRERIFVEGPVELDGEEIAFRADRLEGDLAAETVVLRGHVQVTWSGGTVRGEEISYGVRDGTFTVIGAEEGVEITL